MNRSSSNSSNTKGESSTINNNMASLDVDMSLSLSNRRKSGPTTMPVTTASKPLTTYATSTTTNTVEQEEEEEVLEEYFKNKQDRDELFQESKKWFLQLEPINDDMALMSAKNAILLDSMAMTGGF